MNSTTVLQSFAQLNSDFVVHAAKDTGDRLLKAAGTNKSNLITLAWQTVVGRRPTDDEHQACEQFLAEQTATWQKTNPTDARQLAMADLCHMLLCTNEFIYVE